MKTAASVVLLVIAAVTSSLSHAAVTKCDAVEAKTFAVQWLAFDPDKGTARMQFADTQHSGRITYARDHDKTRRKYNLVFPSPYSFATASEEMEIILFPIKGNQWRIGGVITEVVQGRRHIELLVAGQDVECQTIDL